MQWNRSNTIGLAKASCAQCNGYGLRIIRQGVEVPCNCVFRAVFRACFNRFRTCVAREHHISTATLEFCAGIASRRSYGRKTEEYMADFCLVSQRTLDEFERRVFRNHFLLGADWRLCCRQMKIDRGSFFHAIYRIEQKLGHAFTEIEPYALYPTDEYFGGSVSKAGLEELCSQMKPVRLPRRPVTSAITWEVPLRRTA
jgi:hypothetical protein